LNSGGYLFLGRSEGVSKLTQLFEPIEKKSRIFRKLASVKSAIVNFPTQGASGQMVGKAILPIAAQTETVRLRDLMQQHLLRSYAPAAVLTNIRHQVLYFMGPTAHYLEQPSGVPTQDLLSLAPVELRKSLRTGLKQAADASEMVVLDTVPIHRGKRGRKVKIGITPMAVPGETEALLMVTFEDASSANAKAASQASAAETDQPDPAAVGELENKLRDAQEDLQITLEELETANEELQASNEEMMSSNEELQSSNEELETSKEELQAMNEELSTLNNQLKDKVDELNLVNDDLQNFVASTGIATLLLDSKRQIGRFTPPARNLFNLIDTDIGRPLSDIRQRFKDEAFLADVDTVFQEFRVVEREVSGENGATYFMRIAPYRAIEARLGGVVITFLGVTQLRKQESNLRESESRFRDLFENAPDPLLLVNDQGKIMIANSEAQHFFGFDRQELPGMTIENLIPERFRKHHLAHRKAYLKDARVRAMGAGNDLLARRKDGTELPIEVSLSPIKIDDKTMVCAAIRDISEHQRAILAVREARAEAESALAAKSRFLATASHDLRQPLQSLAMVNEAIMLKIEDPDLHEMGKQQSASLASMRALLNSLLDISKLDAGGVPVESGDVDLETIVADVCDGSQAEAKAKGIELTFEIGARMVHTDADLLKQMLRNLVGNAIRYTKNGSVKVLSQAVGSEIKIEVRDTGVGIPADQLSHIFEEFYQVGRDPQRGDAGLGLGLAIVSRIAKKLGTRIEVVSTVGEGSTFSILLPPSQVVPPKKDVSKPHELPPLVQGSVVLLVDDDAAVLKATKFRLSVKSGLEIWAASSPGGVDELLAKMAPRMPDIIVTDYHLGAAKNGIDIINEARTRAGRQIPAVLVSGDTAVSPADMKQQGIEVAFKPTEGSELVETIARMLASATKRTS
jgi:PAS domain S-box-containing protein